MLGAELGFISGQENRWASPEMDQTVHQWFDSNFGYELSGDNDIHVRTMTKLVLDDGCKNFFGTWIVRDHADGGTRDVRSRLGMIYLTGAAAHPPRYAGFVLASISIHQ